MDNSLRVLAPAKVNLLLKILGKLSNGYHLLNSIIARTDLNDQLDISLTSARGEIDFSCEYSEMLKLHCLALGEQISEDILKIESSENIAVRAAELFIEHFHLGNKFGLKILLHKRIPFAAGLGGGSADAAAVLAALYAMTKVEASVKEMLDLAKELGADVPALLFKQMVFVEGIGDKVSLLKNTEKLSKFSYLPCIILKPCFSISTKQAYEKVAEHLNPQILDEKQQVKPSSESLAIFKSLGLETKEVYLEQTPYNYLTFYSQEGTSPQRENGYFDEILVHFENDFEKVAYAQYGAYCGLLAELKSLGALKVLLAGSGSSLIAFMPSWELACAKAKQAAQIFPEGTFIAPTRVFVAPWGARSKYQ